MSCKCFDISLHSFEFLPKDISSRNDQLDYAQFELKNCEALSKQIKKKNLVSSTFELNSSGVITKIKLKNKATCLNKKYSAIIINNLFCKHIQTLNFLENEVNLTKQHDLNIMIPIPFQHLLGGVNTIVNYIKCVKEYIVVKSEPYRRYTPNISLISTEELELENNHHEKSLYLLELFCSFKNFYSVSFDLEK